LWRPPDRNQRLQQPCGALGKRGVGGHGGELVLPQIDVTPGERGKIGRFHHGAKYTGAPDHGARAKRHNRLCWLRHASGKVAIMTDTSGAETPPIVIKKYANRRLYNTATSSYVTLDDLSRMVKAHTDFVVYDAKTGEDITRAVLTQIIVEEEGKGGQNLLPISFLRQLIGLYGDSMQWLVPRYLEHAMSTFGRNQEQMRKSLQDAFGGLFPFGSLEQMGKQNLALFEQTMKMFSPFGQTTAADRTAPGEKPPNEKPKDPPPSEAALSELQKQINELQQQMQAYGKKEKGEE
jgi:polyhydroxyalkanoate synthesis repressor PhaR